MMVSCVRGVGVIAMHLSRVRKVIRGGVISQSSLTFESRLVSRPAETSITQDYTRHYTISLKQLYIEKLPQTYYTTCKVLILLGCFDYAVGEFA